MKNLFKSAFNFSHIQKICIAGLFISVITILQKVIAINYISFIPFVRVSFGGCAMLILSSLLLGPWYGLLIGAASDLLGYFIFDPKTLGFFPQITAIYALLGFASFFVFKLFSMIKNSKLAATIQYGSLFLITIIVTIYLTFNNSITLYSTTYNIELWQKITIPIVMAVLVGIYVLITELSFKFFNRKFSNEIPYSPRLISLVSFVLELVVMIGFGCFMKGLAFGFETFIAILVSQIIVGFINIPMNTFLISYLLLFFRRHKNVSI